MASGKRLFTDAPTGFQATPVGKIAIDGNEVYFHDRHFTGFGEVSLIVTYTIQEKHISHNQFDDEVIVVNLATGSYFSLHGVAAEIWTLLQQGPASAASLANAFGADEKATDEIDRFLQQLLAQDLIVAGHAPAHAGSSSLPYATPLLEVFDELRELLLADIIHDTDEAGWPHLAPQAKE